MLPSDLPNSPPSTISRPGTSSTTASSLVSHSQKPTLASTTARGSRKDRPCDACRRRKTRCVTQEGYSACGFCKLHSKECTYLEKPAPRKRKAKGEPATDRPRQTRRIQTAATPRTCDLFKGERIGHGSDQALLTPVSDVNLDWWPKGDAIDHADFDQLAEFGEELRPDVGLDFAVSMAWRIPQSQRGDPKSEAIARYLWETWATLLRKQAVDVLPDPTSSALRSVYDVSAAMHERDGLPDVEFASDATVFQHMTSLTKVLAKLLEVFPTASEMPASSDALQDPTRTALTKAKPIQIALKEWFAALPAELRMDHSDTSNDGLSAKPSLNLSYYALEVHLHTRIISSISPITTPAELTAICRHAAKSRLLSAMDFVNRLRPMQLQSSAWHRTAAANFAAIGSFADLLRRSAQDIEEGQWYEQRLREFRWTLGVSARNATWLSPVVGLVDEMLEQPFF
ncbi:hypothetical protein FH972_026002 [Carpinus fangiana]|uniref:Zn(2)-C6 fungal-type domain-containing protein n=1 Tax=Carpinus fangiana TaxID=176857 RepID=A0A5N6L3M9_9ROSI|nr:hypothetical protein FH972_026002 [Carpinus fangiana]